MQWHVKRLSARNIKHKLSVWVNDEERFRATKHEEEVHLMCEHEEGMYLEEEKEDDDTQFAENLMNKENCSC